MLREQPVVPYEQDEVTRAIQDAVSEPVYQDIKDWTARASSASGCSRIPPPAR